VLLQSLLVLKRFEVKKKQDGAVQERYMQSTAQEDRSGRFKQLLSASRSSAMLPLPSTSVIFYVTADPFYLSFLKGLARAPMS